MKFKEKYLYWTFEYSLLIKIVDSVWEIVLGLFILFDKDLTNTIIKITQNEITEDSGSFVAQYIQNFIVHINHGTLLFISIYLIGQAIVKTFLIIGIFRKKLWAYPTAMYAFFAFTFYQIYRFSHTHALVLIFLSLFDLVTILLIQHEYKRAKKHLPDY